MTKKKKPHKFSEVHKGQADAEGQFSGLYFNVATSKWGFNENDSQTVRQQATRMKRDYYS